MYLSVAAARYKSEMTSISRTSTNKSSRKSKGRMRNVVTCIIGVLANQKLETGSSSEKKASRKAAGDRQPASQSCGPREFAGSKACVRYRDGRPRGPHHTGGKRGRFSLRSSPSFAICSCWLSLNHSDRQGQFGSVSGKEGQARRRKLSRADGTPRFSLSRKFSACAQCRERSGAATLLASMKPRHEPRIAEMPLSWLTMGRCILCPITRHSNKTFSGIFVWLKRVDYGVSFCPGEARLWFEKFTRKICVSKICRQCNILIIRITFVTVSAIKGPMTIFEIAHREENNTAIYIKLRSFFVPPYTYRKHHDNIVSVTPPETFNVSDVTSTKSGGSRQKRLSLFNGSKERQIMKQTIDARSGLFFNISVLEQNRILRFLEYSDLQKSARFMGPLSYLERQNCRLSSSTVGHLGLPLLTGA
ncbi:hypothetical protein WN51_13224 [Melipona quadrifasciata]|uniref:Uncharacterized protein n=1 Tax=Melipona quadrifasciata TaxID=166423 RepID=A0A0N0BGW0_9HYME|nr:hypothetical protein WN51_13224 [Melipona quadrifasciata]